MIYNYNDMGVYMKLVKQKAVNCNGLYVLETSFE